MIALTVADVPTGIKTGVATWMPRISIIPATGVFVLDLKSLENIIILKTKRLKIMAYIGEKKK